MAIINSFLYVDQSFTKQPELATATAPRPTSVVPSSSPAQPSWLHGHLCLDGHELAMNWQRRFRFFGAMLRYVKIQISSMIHVHPEMSNFHIG